MSNEMSIDELAAAAGLSRRAIRFYVQQKLLPPPIGLGRGSHYERSHLEQLRQVGELQAAGHSLHAIRRILSGESPPPPPPGGNGRPKRRSALNAELWTRLTLLDGVELHFDASKHQPEVEALVAMKELAQRVFARDDDSVIPSPGNPGEG
jgi:DNA-binding transcriptional MerR regulator